MGRSLTAQNAYEFWTGGRMPDTWRPCHASPVVVSMLALRQRIRKSIIPHTQTSSTRRTKQDGSNRSNQAAHMVLSGKTILICRSVAGRKTPTSRNSRGSAFRSLSFVLRVLPPVLEFDTAIDAKPVGVGGRADDVELGAGFLAVAEVPRARAIQGCPDRVSAHQER